MFIKMEGLSDVLGICAGFIRPSEQIIFWEDTERAMEIRAMLGMRGSPPEAVSILFALREKFGIRPRSGHDHVKDVLFFLENRFARISVSYSQPSPFSQQRPTIHAHELMPFIELLAERKTIPEYYCLSGVNHLTTAKLQMFEGFDKAASLCLIKVIIDVFGDVFGNYMFFNDHLLKRLGRACEIIMEMGGDPAFFDNAIFFFLCGVAETNPDADRVLVACMESERLMKSVAKDPQVREMVHTRIGDFFRRKLTTQLAEMMVLLKEIS